VHLSSHFRSHIIHGKRNFFPKKLHNVTDFSIGFWFYLQWRHHLRDLGVAFEFYLKHVVGLLLLVLNFLCWLWYIRHPEWKSVEVCIFQGVGCLGHNFTLKGMSHVSRNVEGLFVLLQITAYLCWLCVWWCRDGVDDPLEDHALVTQQLDQVCPLPIECV